MLKLSSNTFTKELKLKLKTNPLNFIDSNIKHFDNDGFELSKLEIEYYKSNGVELNFCLNHCADQKDWFISEDKNFIVDHSLLLQRWEFHEYAREQIYDFSKQFPQLNKYLRLKAKWGFDFALEYIDQYDVIEVLHIESDFRVFEQALEARTRAEEKILSTDWQDFVKKLKNKRSEWDGLSVTEQNDWKASYWGLKKAEITYKAFV